VFWDIMQWKVAIPNRRFGTTYRPHRQKSVSLRNRLGLIDRGRWNR